MSFLVIAAIVVVAALSPVLGTDSRTPELLDTDARALDLLGR